MFSLEIQVKTLTTFLDSERINLCTHTESQRDTLGRIITILTSALYQFSSHFHLMQITDLLAEKVAQDYSPKKKNP